MLLPFSTHDHNDDPHDEDQVDDHFNNLNYPTMPMSLKFYMSSSLAPPLICLHTSSPPSTSKVTLDYLKPSHIPSGSTGSLSSFSSTSTSTSISTEEEEEDGDGGIYYFEKPRIRFEQDEEEEEECVRRGIPPWLFRSTLRNDILFDSQALVTSPLTFEEEITTRRTKRKRQREKKKGHIRKSISLPTLYHPLSPSSSETLEDDDPLTLSSRLSSRRISNTGRSKTSRPQSHPSGLKRLSASFLPSFFISSPSISSVNTISACTSSISPDHQHHQHGRRHSIALPSLPSASNLGFRIPPIGNPSTILKNFFLLFIPDLENTNSPVFSDEFACEGLRRTIGLSLNCSSTNLSSSSTDAYPTTTTTQSLTDSNNRYGGKRRRRKPPMLVQMTTFSPLPLENGGGGGGGRKEGGMFMKRPVRVLQNGRGMRMLVLEMQMVKRGKIVAPLKGRSVLVKMRHEGRESGSLLRCEVARNGDV